MAKITFSINSVSSFRKICFYKYNIKIKNIYLFNYLSCIDLQFLLSLHDYCTSFSGYITEVAAMLKETQSAGFYMQILHFCFSLGGMISPLVARPFLAPEVADVHTSLNCNFSLENLKDTKFSGEKTEYNFDNYWLDSLNDSDVIRNKTFVDCDKQFAETNVMYAYLITAGMLVFAAMMFIAASIFDTKNKEQPRLVVKNGLHNSKLEETPFYQRVVFICLMSFLLFLYVGSEVTFAGFLSSFTSLQLNWSKYKGALATSVFWIAFGLARFAGIWLAKVLKTVTFLFTFPSLLVISHSLLLVVTSVNNDLVVMVCVGMIGISMSVIFASVITWTTENVTMVTGRISALFIASCSIGIMIFPLLFGYMMDLFSPSWFNYLLIGIAVLWLVIFSITFILSKRLLTAHTVEIEIVEKQPFQTDEWLISEQHVLFS